jgi:hypothetical protein
MLVIVTYILLQTISAVGLLENINQILSLCANFKQNRLPAFYRLLVPKYAHIGTRPHCEQNPTFFD